MKKYRGLAKWWANYEFEVEAENEDEAFKKLMELAEEHDVSWDIELSDEMEITEIK